MKSEDSHEVLPPLTTNNVNLKLVLSGFTGLLIGMTSTLGFISFLNLDLTLAANLGFSKSNLNSYHSREFRSSKWDVNYLNEAGDDYEEVEAGLSSNPGLFRTQLSKRTVVPTDCVPIGTIPSVNATSAPVNTTSTPLNSAPSTNSTSPINLKLYSALVSFGDSFSDNGHVRPSWEFPTFRTEFLQLYGGRNTNGPVAVEYLANSTSLTENGTPMPLYDYALGGTMIDNSLVSSPYPSAGDQINSYLTDLANKNVALGNARVLHTYLSGLNPLFRIFRDVWDSNSITNPVALANALNQVTLNANAVGAQLKTLSTNPALLNATTSDFLLMALPPLQLSPFFWLYCGGNPAGVAFLTLMTNTFNAVLLQSVATLTPVVAANGGKIFYFDLAALITAFSIGSPQNYGFDKVPAWVFQPCFDENAKTTCAQPDSYLMWDTLHLTTRAHRYISQAIQKLLMA